MVQKKLFELSDNSSYTTLNYAEFVVEMIYRLVITFCQSELKTVTNSLRFYFGTVVGG